MMSVFMSELKQKVQEHLKAQNGKTEKKDDDLVHLRFSQMNDSDIFSDIFDLVMLCADKSVSKTDKEKIDTFFKHFICGFFCLERRKL
jgi:hypothetical protein